MANYSGADLSANEQAYAAADKPILASINALDGASAGRWATTANGSDVTDSNSPISRAYDRLGHLTTKPTSSGATFWVRFTMPSTVDDFDGVLLWNTKNIDGWTVSVRIASDNAYTTDAEEIATTTASGTQRIAFLDLQDSGASVAQRYSQNGTFYVWIYLDENGTGNDKPQIGEIWFLRRRQMPHFPRLSYDPNAYNSDKVVRMSRAGIPVSYVNHSGRQDLSASFNPSLTADHTEMKSFIADTGYGSKPFVWIPNPSTAPEQFRIIQPPQDPGLGFPYTGWTERQITISGTEIYPFQTTDVP